MSAPSSFQSWLMKKMNTTILQIFSKYVIYANTYIVDISFTIVPCVDAWTSITVREMILLLSAQPRYPATAEWCCVTAAPPYHRLLNTCCCCSSSPGLNHWQCLSSYSTINMITYWQPSWGKGIEYLKKCDRQYNDKYFQLFHFFCCSLLSDIKGLKLS